MAMIEIDETELANYRQLADAHNKALRDPKARPLLIDALAEVNPQVANAPDRLLRREMDERFGGISEKLDKFMSGWEERDAKRAEEAQIAALQGNLAAGRKVATPTTGSRRWKNSRLRRASSTTKTQSPLTNAGILRRLPSPRVGQGGISSPFQKRRSPT